MAFGKIAQPPQIPANRRLWEMLIAQAKHRFRVYPSMAASHWVHEQYVNQGGQFVRSKKHIHKALKKLSEQDDPR